jgi:hypothetical protein
MASAEFPRPSCDANEGIFATATFSPADVPSYIPILASFLLNAQTMAESLNDRQAAHVRRF